MARQILCQVIGPAEHELYGELEVSFSWPLAHYRIVRTGDDIAYHFQRVSFPFDSDLPHTAILA
jgi:hypothetical protein